MATLKCLACGQDNKIGDESCASCSSSLNLRLCSACEAINANSAQRCHSCSAQFTPQAEVTSAVEDGGQEAPVDEKVLPAAWVVGAAQATRRNRRVTAAFWLAPLLAAAGVTYYFYGTPQPAPAQAATVRPASVEIKQQEPTSAPVADTRDTRAVELKRALAPVTHTRTTGDATPPKEEPVKVIPPASAVIPATAKAAGGSAPLPVEQRVRVTHTKAGASEAASAEKPEPAGCAPGVAALGLCKSD